MARLAVLEQTKEERVTQTQQPRSVSVEEKEHIKQMDKYRKMLFSDAVETEETTVSSKNQAFAPVAEPKPVSHAQSFTDYKPYTAPAGKRELFAGISYKNGELIAEAPAVADSVAPAYAPAPVKEPEPAYVPDEDDAVPTARTMNTLRQSEAQTASAERTKFLSAVSTRAKIVLAAVVFAIVMAIVVICINTGIINSLDANVTDLKAQVLREQQVYNDLGFQIEQIKNFEGPISEMVKDYAESNGMVRK